MTKVDYLTEDSLLPEGQKYLCISFLSDPNNKITLCGIKIRGIFETYELACEHAKKLQLADPYFNVFVGECGKWLPYDPNPDSKNVKDSEYANEELNNMMKSYLENQEKAKVFHEQRKTELMKKNILDNLSNVQNNIDNTKNEIKKGSHTDKEKEIMNNDINTFEEQMAKLNFKKEELDKQLDIINEDLKAFKANSSIADPKIINIDSK